KAVDVRIGTRRRVLRWARDSENSSRGGAGSIPLLGAHIGNREKRTLSNEDERSECKPARSASAIARSLNKQGAAINRRCHDDYQQESTTQAHISERPQGHSHAAAARRDHSGGNRPG